MGEGITGAAPNWISSVQRPMNPPKLDLFCWAWRHSLFCGLPPCFLN
ncbi:MAG: hypothetical protein AVDCRST_MAG55-2713 [uncultured Rubrobacteraceae bacterium]|uniref:Uncharacterized protein n=1 Tax=uncultured Rubrobacteraceae bacterium TaxID=349277 RepID=A0A6J4Q698_9ACTN|nr:MAG: hypothetical protein AVDCRST_MAG55-2713 [uncultured Rubrobacteraceae bacterium]